MFVRNISQPFLLSLFFFLLNYQSIHSTVINFDTDSEFDSRRGNWGWYGKPCVNEGAGLDCDLKRGTERQCSQTTMKYICEYKTLALYWSPRQLLCFLCYYQALFLVIADLEGTFQLRSTTVLGCLYADFLLVLLPSPRMIATSLLPPVQLCFFLCLFFPPTSCCCQRCQMFCSLGNDRTW